jgi:hypothetical protein
MAHETEGEFDSGNPRADVTHLMSYEPDGAVFGRSSGGRYGVGVYLGLEVPRSVAHRRDLDMKEGSKRELGGIPAEHCTHRVENF